MISSRLITSIGSPCIGADHLRPEIAGNEHASAEVGAGAEVTLQILRDEVLPRGARMGAPGFAGWVTTTPTVVPVAAKLSASIAGSQTCWVQSYSFLEQVALQWLKQLLGLSSAVQGVFSSGGSVAKLIGLGAAVGM